MKKLLLLSIVFGCSILCYPVFSQNNQNPGQLGLPGDNFNLYAVLSIFQQSQTLEEFEQKINAQDTRVNNLDLDGDGKIDYIKVIDNVNGNAHIIVLRDMINETESQDVAVIEVEKDKNNQIEIQIIGDIALYGKDYIVEPAQTGTPNPGYNQNQNTTVSSGGSTTIVNNNYYTNDNVGYGAGFVYAVGAWSIIHYMFAPSYVVYSSPYRYGYYPTYWHPWQPLYYDDYYGHWRTHESYGYFHQTHEYRVPAARAYYEPRRSTSVVVHQSIERGDYKRNYTRNNVESHPDRNARNINNNRGNNNGQYRGGNRNSAAPVSKPAPSNNYNRGNAPVRSDARPSTTPNTRTDARPVSNPNTNTRTAIKTDAKPNPASSPNTRSNSKSSKRSNTKSVKKSNAKPAAQKEEHKESERR